MTTHRRSDRWSLKTGVRPATTHPLHPACRRFINAFPLKLVQVFERHGWIWGGRWYHHDTMHFKYRPELTGADACQNR
ncbi:hypothetical protein CBQ26_15135 [Deinococcus indicus]|uniref:Peptidase M15C domain-containing protein n=1 Tax=Deinococcus indicus TaxID=223556 RepID=A0A246BHC1_9DEIO|nr:M15 family metallopeptidase [Deinococcus indicus]OWL94626.1 hypothetical protein CBQ26_15135 [Deinococcus indicus]